MSKRGRAPSLRELAAYLEREVTASEAAGIERSLADSAEARRQLAELQRIRDALSEAPPELAGLDLVSRLGVAIDAGLPAVAPERGRWAWPLGVIAGLAAALVACAFFLRVASEPEFRAKAAGAQHEPQRWAGVTVYRVAAEGVPVRLAERLPAGEGLVFSYTNLGPRPFSHLMIFGVDARGEVHWFHPAYENAASDPASLPIRGGEAAVALAELIHHDLPAGVLTLHALFTMRPCHVLEVEQLLKRGGGSLGALPDSSEQLISTRVEP